MFGRNACVILTLIACLGSSRQVDAKDYQPNQRLRRPVCLDWIGSTQAAIGNRTGSISILDLSSREIVDEVDLGQSITDLAVIDATTMVVISNESHALLVLSRDSAGWSVIARHPLSQEPVDLQLNSDRTIATVSSLWSHRLTTLNLATPSRPETLVVTDLPFAPKLHAWINDREALVAAAFGGELAIVDIMNGRIVRQRELLATHNISGINIEGRRVKLTHLMLNHEQATTGSNVHWGDIMSNVVRTMDLDWFLSSKPEETTAADIYYLGHPDDATGDPEGILTTKDRRQIIAFAGIDEIGISDPGANYYRRVPVGRRPSAFALNHDESLLLVTNRFDDSVSFIDTQRRKPITTVSLGPTRELTLEEEGEILFYDSTLSSDGWFSCHSCHTDGHSNGQLSDTFGDGYRGSPKRVLTLLGAHRSGPYAWNGQVTTLEEQVEKSIKTTMRGPQPTAQQVAAITAFVETLVPPPGISLARSEVDFTKQKQGRAIFESAGCVECHRADQEYTTAENYDVGLVDVEGNREFNPPSLRGVSQKPRLLHDRSAHDYREALQIHPNGKPLELSADEWDALNHFLNSL